MVFLLKFKTPLSPNNVQVLIFMQSIYSQHLGFWTLLDLCNYALLLHYFFNDFATLHKIATRLEERYGVTIKQHKQSKFKNTKSERTFTPFFRPPTLEHAMLVCILDASHYSELDRPITSLFMQWSVQDDWMGFLQACPLHCFCSVCFCF